MNEAFNTLDKYEPAKNCVDVSILIIDRLEKEIDEYTSLLANRLHHYSNVAATLADRMSRFSREIEDWKEEQEKETEDGTEKS